MNAQCKHCTLQSPHPAPPTARPPLSSLTRRGTPHPRNPRNPTPDAYPHHHTLCSPPDLTPTRGTRTLSSLTRRVNHAPAPTPPASANAHTSSHPTAPGESPRIAAKRPNPIPLSCPPGKPKTHLLLFLLPAPPAAPCPRCPAPAEPALTPPLLPPPPHHPAPEHPRLSRLTPPHRLRSPPDPHALSFRPSFLLPPGKPALARQQQSTNHQEPGGGEPSHPPYRG